MFIFQQSFLTTLFHFKCELCKNACTFNQKNRCTRCAQLVVPFFIHHVRTLSTKSKQIPCYSFINYENEFLDILKHQKKYPSHQWMQIGLNQNLFFLNSIFKGSLKNYYLLSVPEREEKKIHSLTETFTQALGRLGFSTIHLPELKRTKNSTPQKFLSQIDRESRPSAELFKLKPNLFFKKKYSFQKKLKVILVDDIITTGATLTALYDLFVQSDFFNLYEPNVVGALSLGFTPRKDISTPTSE